MKCTSCKQGKLIHGYLDNLFPSHNCDHCGGSWIHLHDYLSWLECADQKSLTQPENVEVNEAIEANETKHAMLCPVTGTIMLKYRISKDTSHRIDLSPSINGIWLDKGEWALLKAAGLAGSLNKIFTAPWQRKIKAENATEVLDASYRNQFGEPDYQKLKEIRTWLDDNDQRSLMIAYLAAKDPYSAVR